MGNLVSIDSDSECPKRIESHLSRIEVLEVLTTSDPETALDWAATDPIDSVNSDYQEPGGDVTGL